MNFDIDGDEAFVLWTTSAIGLVAIIKWLLMLGRVGTFAGKRSQRLPLYVFPLAGLGVVFWALWFWSAHEIQENRTYVILFMTTAVTWLAIAQIGFRWFGISVRDDALENRNEAATAAVSGGFLGVALAFAGSNIGEGPSIWNTMFAAAVATAAFFLLWGVLELTTHVSDVIAIDRDLASGIRLAGLLVAIGLILGRAAAGDWESAEATVRDLLRLGWPTAALVVFAAVMQKYARPTPRNPVPATALFGWMPAILFVLVAVLYVLSTGHWRTIPASGS